MADFARYQNLPFDFFAVCRCADWALSFSEELYRAEEAGREEFVGGLVEAADGGDGVFLAGLHIADHTVAPDVGDLDLQKVVSFFEERLDVGGSERGLPEDAGWGAVDGKVCDVLHNT